MIDIARVLEEDEVMGIQIHRSHKTIAMKQLLSDKYDRYVSVVRQFGEHIADVLVALVH
jgi:hypothetical protein